MARGKGGDSKSRCVSRPSYPANKPSKTGDKSDGGGSNARAKSSSDKSFSKEGYYALLLIIICCLGCGDSPSYISVRAYIYNLDVEIYSQATPIKNSILLERHPPDIPENRKGVIAFIQILGDGCDDYGSPYFVFPETSRYLWEDGDTIEIEVSVNKYEPSGGDCLTVEYKYNMAIFLGFCSPGEYRLEVNDAVKVFTVD